MATELVLRKRPAAHAGEMGLFCESEVWSDDFSAIKNGADVKCVVSQSRSLRQHKFAWALATKVAEACDFLDTKNDAMDYMLIEARHARFIHDPLRKISYAVPKPTNWTAMDGVAYTKLLRRMTHVVATHIVPGIDKAELRAEIEKMLHPDLIPTDMGPEPPPVDTIPDGPGIGHNSRRAAEPARDAPEPARPQTAGQRTATQRPPQARETPTGVPDWATGVEPLYPEHYHHYARYHIDRKQTLGLAIGWLLGDQQTALRTKLGLAIGSRKQLERYAAEKHGGVK